MSELDLGTLVGHLDLEGVGFDKAIDKALDHIKGFSSKIPKIMGAAGVGIGAAVGGSILAGMNLEPARDKLAAQLGLTEGESARIGKIAGKVYAGNYGDSLEEVNSAVAAVMSSIDGMSTGSSKGLKSATTNVLNFAKAFDVDVNRAAQVAGEAVKYGLAKNATDAFDLITTASSRVPAALRGDVLDAVDEYGPVFNQLGISGQQAFSLLVDGSKKGMYGIDKTGDAVKEFTLQMANLTPASQAVFKTLGLNSHQLANDMLAGGDKASKATKTIVDGLLTIKDPAKQAQAAIGLFGTPLEDLGTKNIPKFLKSLQGGSHAMDGFKNAADRMNKTLSGNAVSSLASMKRQAQLAFYTLGNFALPAINNVTAAMASGLGPAARKASNYVKDFGTRINAVLAPIGGLSAVGTGLAIVITAILIPALIAWGVQSTIAATKSVVAWTITQLAAIQSAGWQTAGFLLIKAGWIMVGVQSMLGAAKVAAAWLIAMGPIGLAIAAIVGVVYLVVKYWDQIKAATSAAWDWVSGKISSAVSWILGFVGQHWPLILAILTGPIGLATLAIIRNWDKIKGAGSTLIGWVKAIPGKLKSLAGSFGDAGHALINAFVNGLKNIGGGIGNIAGSIWGSIKSLLNSAIDQINSKLNFTIKVPGPVPDIPIHAGVIPRLAKGGIVKARPGGTLALLAEAGHDEAVVPLSGPNAPKAGTTSTGAAPYASPANSKSENPTVVQNIYPRETQSEQQIGNASANRFLFALDIA